VVRPVESPVEALPLPATYPMAEERDQLFAQQVPSWGSNTVHLTGAAPSSSPRPTVRARLNSENPRRRRFSERVRALLPWKEAPDEADQSMKPRRPGMCQRAAVLIGGVRLVLGLLSFILDCDGR
jgi:hypothetical protein